MFQVMFLFRFCIFAKIYFFYRENICNGTKITTTFAKMRKLPFSPQNIHFLANHLLDFLQIKKK
jgi:hypothetical protein